MSCLLTWYQSKFGIHLKNVFRCTLRKFNFLIHVLSLLFLEKIMFSHFCFRFEFPSRFSFNFSDQNQFSDAFFLRKSIFLSCLDFHFDSISLFANCCRSILNLIFAWFSFNFVLYSFQIFYFVLILSLQFSIRPSLISSDLNHGA
jgi:hypothetical protein